VLQVRQLRFRFPKAVSPLFADLDFDLGGNERAALTGPSGVGKTTFLFTLAGLWPREAGEIVWGGRSLPADEAGMSRVRNARMGVVFQSYNLLPDLTVAENLALRLAIAGRPADRNRMTDLLDRVGLVELIDAPVGRLSGGQQQRVAAVRALIAEPELILADEPTGNLDDASAASLIDLLLDPDRPGAALIVTHDERVLARVDRAVDFRALWDGGP